MVSRRGWVLIALELGLLCVVAAATNAHYPKASRSGSPAVAPAVSHRNTSAQPAYDSCADPSVPVEWKHLWCDASGASRRGDLVGWGLGHTPQRDHSPARSFPWKSLGVGGAALAVIALAGLGIRGRRGRLVANQKAQKLAVAREISEIIEQSVDELLPEADSAAAGRLPRGKNDPRGAVIAAYARMEKALEAADLPRHSAETPREYLARAMHERLDTSAPAASRLTDLFEWARFSRHEVRPAMRYEAVAALLALRDELRMRLSPAVSEDLPAARRHRLLRPFAA
jgi:hypothetical protein